jgi:hypothetical protein
MGSSQDVRLLREDKYRVNFKKLRKKIDAEFGLGDVMQTLLSDKMLSRLNSFTHAGLEQLGRCYENENVQGGFSINDVVNLIYATTSALFVLTVLLATHFKVTQDRDKAIKLFIEWIKRRSL